MEHQSFHNLFERRPFIKSKTPAVKWFKEWVPQDVVATGGKCLVLKWVTEDQIKALQDKTENPVTLVEPEPEPTTEVLFLCSYEGCGKTFIDAGALRKHSHIHGERQYVCHYENCGKKFLDSSKLKRHFLIHTGERDFVCPHEGCGKAFSLDFNLRSHMKTHSQENYHICPFQECGKRYAHEYKLKNHILSHHEKQNLNNLSEFPPKYVQVQHVEKQPPNTKPPKVAASSTYATASSDRPYACPYEGCDKAYIHEYKLNLHLRREHPGHLPEEYPKNAPRNKNNTDADMDAGSDHDGQYAVKRGNTKSQKPSRPKPNIKLPPTKAVKRKAPPAAAGKKQPWPVVVKAVQEEEEDSEETEEDRDNGEDGWRYGGGGVDNDDDDDEETEDED
ncbi:zinc finger transcription factor YY1 isoform X1 [Helianthus annuus]|uniref:Putative zinc finger (C2H2 type) family protein n=1 Tax=Helianthus annuus TaxID=4232 RepID=A0A251U2Z4_HELAN|nr:zinc finger transcription factor YY1 isoform X1 [Helianthus annuus]